MLCLGQPLICNPRENRPMTNASFVLVQVNYTKFKYNVQFKTFACTIHNSFKCIVAFNRPIKLVKVEPLKMPKFDGVFLKSKGIS